MIIPDALTTRDAVKDYARIRGTAQDANLLTLAGAVSAAIARWCKRPFFLASNPANPVTEFLDGNSCTQLQLKHLPVQAPILTGCSTTQGSAVVGVPSTAYLFVGQGVTGAGLAQNSYVTTVGSSTVTLGMDNSGHTATVAAPATATLANASLLFGPAVWADPNGYYGTGTNAFPFSSRLYEGSNFALRRDSGNGGESNTGLLECIVTGLLGWGFFPGWNMGAAQGWGGRLVATRGVITPRLLNSQGAIKVQYVAGLQFVPPDLQLGATKLAALMARDGRLAGQPRGAEDLASQAGNLLNTAMTGDAELVSVFKLINPFRRHDRAF